MHFKFTLKNTAILCAIQDKNKCVNRSGRNSLPQWSLSWVLRHRPQQWECMNPPALCPTVPSQIYGPVEHTQSFIIWHNPGREIKKIFLDWIKLESFCPVSDSKLVKETHFVIFRYCLAWFFCSPCKKTHWPIRFKI